ncbi:MAG: hypothetical protein IKY44_05205 [Clostridia bacterium]|nr:hypothetical protein [Clostridia bacterium]
MTIKNDIILWDDEANCLCLLSIPSEQQYKYIDGLPCITFGVSYENATFKGYDTFTLFDRFYNNILNELKSTYDSLNGTIRICDIGADTDGYIEFVVKNGVAFVKGQLGASFSSYSLKFEFQADQTLIGRLMQAIELR